MSMALEDANLILFEQFASVAQALAHAHRLLLLQLLAQGERSVKALADASGLGLTNVSQHLQRLSHAGLVVSRRAERQIFYRLSDDTVLTLIATLRKVAERRVAEVRAVVQDYFLSLDDSTPVARVELLELLRKKKVTIIDVRPPEEFLAGHLPGAINVPLGELRQHLNNAPQDRHIVAYCRGPYCLMSYEAVHLLRQRGFKARRLEDGFPEWKAAGFPVESGQAGESDSTAASRNGVRRKKATESPAIRRVD
jgi:rhodanese-related sulfurtransferase/DNA-binding transcriptional ArsR family regulator